MAIGSFPILFITATRIGDAVLSSGLIKRLHDEVPQASFTIVAGPVAAPLFMEVPNLDEVIVFAKAKDGSHWFDLWRKVRKRRWGLIVDMRGSGGPRAPHRGRPGPAPHLHLALHRGLRRRTHRRDRPDPGARPGRQLGR
jgi:hypothetical protein